MAGTAGVAPVERDTVAEVAEATRAEPAAGVLLRSYRLSLRSIDWTGRTVGGTAIGSTRLLGLPRERTEQLARAQSQGLHAVVDWSDRMGTHWAHGVGASRRYAASGAKLAARGWAREMRFFITLH